MIEAFSILASDRWVETGPFARTPHRTRSLSVSSPRIVGLKHCAAAPPPAPPEPAFSILASDRWVETPRCRRPMMMMMCAFSILASDRWVETCSMSVR